MGFFLGLIMELQPLKSSFLAQFSPLERGEAERQFYLLLEDKYALKRIDLISGRKELSLNDLKNFKTDLKALALGKPVQHLIGWTYFCGKKIKVNPEVLIPRPETEELSQLIQSRIPNFKRAIDLATGSGCLAISLGSETREIYALEKSKEALKIARENAERNQVKIHFIEDDILEPQKKWPENLDLVVSNPPYVRYLEKASMEAKVLDHEPSMALFVKDEDPLIFYRAIASYASTALKKGGVLTVEINQYLGQETKNLLQSYFEKVELLKDQFEQNRFLWAEK